MTLLDRLETLRREHDGGCWNPCTCGASTHNATLDDCIQEVRELQAPTAACCGCSWQGPAPETVHPKHDPKRLLCPECGEVVELLEAALPLSPKERATLLRLLNSHDVDGSWTSGSRQHLEGAGYLQRGDVATLRAIRARMLP